jgi:hypothetical protein
MFVVKKKKRYFHGDGVPEGTAHSFVFLNGPNNGG